MESPKPTITEERISDFVSSATKTIEKSPQMDESNTKVKLIQPFLEDVLGWDIHHMDLEYSVQMGGQTYHVDYALTIEDIPEVFVEAKGCDTPLKQKDINQLQSYLKLQDVTWGLLTNGKQYKLYELSFDNGQAEFHPLADSSIESLNEHRRSLSAISKTSIERGESKDVVKYIREMNRAEQTLIDEKTDIADSIAETVSEATSDILYQEAQTEGKELVDRLINHLQEESTTTSSTGTGPDEIDQTTGSTIEDIIPTIPIEELGSENDAQVAVYPSNESGIEFITDHKAWGFISIDSQPEYFLLYLTQPHQVVRYLGVVEAIIDAKEFIAKRDIPQEKHKFKEGKKVVEFSDVYELEEPIPLGTENPHRMQGLLYTTMENVIEAGSTDDF